MNIDSSDSVVRALSEQMRDFDREVFIPNKKSN